MPRTRGPACGPCAILLLPLLLASALAAAPARGASHPRPPEVAPAPSPLPLPEDDDDAPPPLAPPPLGAPAEAPPAKGAAAAGAVRTDRLRLFGMMDREVVGPDHDTVGHIIDVLVNEDGRPQAVLVETGGFMGVGDRKIAIGWRDIVFDEAHPDGPVHTAMTTDQVRAAPAYQPGAPAIVAIGAPLPPPPPAPPPVAPPPAPLELSDGGAAPPVAAAPAPLAAPVPTPAARLSGRRS